MNQPAELREAAEAVVDDAYQPRLDDPAYRLVMTHRINALRAALAQPDEGAKLAQMVLREHNDTEHQIHFPPSFLVEQARKVLNSKPE